MHSSYLRTTAVFSILISALFFSPMLFAAGNQNVTITVPGIVCPTSARDAAAAVKQVPGVVDVQSDFEKHVIKVTYDDVKTNPDAMKTALDKAGFPADAGMAEGDVQRCNLK